MPVSSAQVYTLILLSGAIAALAAILAFAVLRFVAAARDARARAQDPQTETAFMATAIQQAVQRLREQERELQARAEASERLSDEIIAGIASGLMLVEGAGVVRLVNPAGVRLLGLTGQATEGRQLRDLLGHALPLAEVVEEGLRTGRSIARRAVAVPVPPSAGSATMHLGVTVSPISANGRQGTAVICLFTDLTEVVAREEQVRLKESLARLGELTAGLAHEFRNGLSTIHGYARMLDPAVLPSDAATYVKGIRQETEALGEVVTNFLNFARPTQLALGPVEVASVVARVAADWQPEVERLGGRVEVAGEFATVEGDEVLLRQALDNLCRNAVEACRSAARPPIIVVTGRRASADRQLVVRIEDNGRGIDPSAFARLFQPFFTTKSDGTGLGLALVQKIVVTHNGRVTASNRREGGAAFEVRLPLDTTALTSA